jgi:protein-disulfide isomerase
MRLAAAWHRVFSVPGQKQSKRRRREAQAAAAVPRGRPIRGATRSAGRKVRVQSPAPAPTVRRASPKVLLAAAALLVLASIGIGVAVAVSGGSSRSTADIPRRGSLVNALPGAGAVHRLFAGIPQRGNELGRSSAPVTLVEYIDPQCPYCREFVATALPRLVTRYVRSGKLRIEARPIAILGPDSLRGNRAIVAAGQQGRLFNVAELLYFNQGAENTGWLSDAMITAAAASIPGLDVPRLLDAQGGARVDDRLQALASLAKADEVSRTPTILIGKTGEPARPVSLTSAADVRPVVSAINRELAA